MKGSALKALYKYAAALLIPSAAGAVICAPVAHADEAFAVCATLDEYDAALAGGASFSTFDDILQALTSQLGYTDVAAVTIVGTAIKTCPRYQTLWTNYMLAPYGM